MCADHVVQLGLQTSGLGTLVIDPAATTRGIVAPSPRPAPLLEFASDVHSHDGEDGVLQALFARLGARHRYAVEFGAWDGLKYSNCADLFRAKGWSGCLTGGNPDKFRDLRRNFSSFPQVALLERMVSWSGQSALDELLSAVHAPTDFDLLSSSSGRRR